MEKDMKGLNNSRENEAKSKVYKTNFNGDDMCFGVVIAIIIKPSGVWAK